MTIDQGLVDGKLASDGSVLEPANFISDPEGSLLRARVLTYPVRDPKQIRIGFINASMKLSTKAVGGWTIVGEDGILVSIYDDNTDAAPSKYLGTAGHEVGHTLTLWHAEIDTTYRLTCPGSYVPGVIRARGQVFCVAGF